MIVSWTYGTYDQTPLYMDSTGVHIFTYSVAQGAAPPASQEVYMGGGLLNSVVLNGGSFTGYGNFGI